MMSGSIPVIENNEDIWEAVRIFLENENSVFFSMNFICSTELAVVQT